MSTEFWPPGRSSLVFPLVRYIRKELIGLLNNVPLPKKKKKKLAIKLGPNFVEMFMHDKND